MTYNSRLIFAEIEQRLSLNPAMRLSELTRELGCSHPAIEKAVKTHAGLPFGRYQQQKRLEAAQRLKRQGYSAKYIGISLGYRWPGNFSRFSAHAVSNHSTVEPVQESPTSPFGENENFKK
jgi:AraC-like DNA-binding protein